MQELEEMGIIWSQEMMDTMEDGVMVVGSHKYPPCHGGVTPSSHNLLTIDEKGVEVGDGGDGHLTGDGEWPTDTQNTFQYPQTPGLSVEMSGLCVEVSECVFRQMHRCAHP